MEFHIYDKALMRDFFSYWTEDRPSNKEIEDYDCISVYQYSVYPNKASVDYVKDRVSHLISDDVDWDQAIEWAKAHSIDIE